MCFVQRFADHPAADHPAGPGRPWHPAGQRPPVPEPV
jgi:hypothetical protein